MHEDPVQGIWNIWENLLEIDDPVVKNDIHIVFAQAFHGRMLLFDEILNKNISHADKVDQHIAKTKEIIGINVLPVTIVEVKVNPAVVTGVAIHENMIAPYVPVLLTMLMQETDPLNTFYVAIQNPGQLIMVVSFVIRFNTPHVF